eukprot:SAG11_NODE_4459_length_1888_cov_1.320291_2_plen_174_part_00
MKSSASTLACLVQHAVAIVAQEQMQQAAAAAEAVTQEALAARERAEAALTEESIVRSEELRTLHADLDKQVQLAETEKRLRKRAEGEVVRLDSDIGGTPSASNLQATLPSSVQCVSFAIALMSHCHQGCGRITICWSQSCASTRTSLSRPRTPQKKCRNDTSGSRGRCSPPRQ